MSTMTKWIAPLSLLLLTTAQSPRAQAKSYFRENFRNYSSVAPTLVSDAGINLDNDPIWSNSAAANIELGNAGLVMRNFEPAATVAAALTNYQVSFRFRLRPALGDDAATGAFQLVMRGESAGKSLEARIGIRDAAVTLAGSLVSVPAQKETALPFALGVNVWHSGVFTVKGRQATLSLDNDRVMQQVLSFTLPQIKFEGINFWADKGQPFSLSDIEVRDPEALPDHAITNIMALPRPYRADLFKPGGAATVAANDIFGATVVTGADKDAVRLTVSFADGSKRQLSFSAIGIADERTVEKDGKKVKEKFERPDAIIEMNDEGDHSRLSYYIRPMLRRYSTSYSHTDTWYDIVRDWGLLPSASRHTLKIELRTSADGADLYLDGRFVKSLQGGGKVSDAAFACAPTAMLGPAFSYRTAFDQSKFLPLDVDALNMARSFANAQVSLQPGFGEVAGVPMRVAPAAGSADIGLARAGQGNWALEVDEYLARSAFDGLLTAVHFAVPGGAPYDRAWVLCAVDPDPAKVPILTTRIARYVHDGIGGNLVADTHTVLPQNGQAPGPGVKKVGTVTRTSADGKKQQVPLYLVEVTLDSGKIIDRLMDPAPLDFEFFGKPGANLEQIDTSPEPDPTSTSAVQVFGATLEKASVGLAMVQAQPANVFAGDDRAETSAVLNAFGPAAGTLSWRAADETGKQVLQGEVPYTFAGAGEKKTVVIPLKTVQPGWFSLQISLRDAAGNTLYTHRAAFAQLGSDQRRAGYESPYGTWWFDGAHNTPKDIDFAGPVMHKAGIRLAGWTSLSEAQMAKYGITKSQFTLPVKFGDLKYPEVITREIDKQVTAALLKYPHLRELLLFHESGPGNDIPLELIGVQPVLSPDRLAYEKRYADMFNLVAPYVHQKWPQLRLVVGNNSASQANIAAILRHGGKAEWLDSIGIEAPSQVYIPEKLQEWGIQGLNIAKDTAKVLGGRDIPATGCYEFTYRSERDMGQAQQAAWYTRDALISLANNFTRIGPGILFDTSNAYYNGLWGASGLLERAPYGYPKQAYVAFATLTNVLDRVKLHRQIATGSTTAYALEFNRADNKLASALWTARGTADYNLQFAADSSVEVIDMYGRRSRQNTQGSKLTIASGTAPTYVVADREITSITLSNRRFPADLARAQAATVAAPLDSAAAVTLEADSSLDTPQVFPLQLPVRLHDEFTVQQVVDETKGNCLEVAFKAPTKADANKYLTSYATLRLKTPALVEGKPAALGLWVKGNSNWGRVLFEIEDAGGEVWRSIGTAGWGCDVLDWPGHAAVNYDGWNYVAMPLTASNLFVDHSPGPVLEQWVSGGGDKVIDYPIKIRAITLEMNRVKLDLIDFKAASTSLRIKDAGGIAAPETAPASP